MAAQSRIGATELARNTVSQLSTSGSSAIQVGDDVFANEKVGTGKDSAAKFVFSDSTNLAIGETSSVTLDRFVYKGDTTYTKAAVNFVAGAFRFTTGGSEKGAYQLKTSTATIGVRGTQFDLSVRNGVTKLTLLEGEVAICPRSRFDGDPRKLTKAQLKAHDCLDLTVAGQTAQVSSRSASLSKTPVDFASACGGAAGLCSVSVATASDGRIGTGGTAALDPSDPALCYASQD
jgi:hypothetical protein